MLLIHYFPVLRSEKFLYAITVEKDVDYVLSNTELTLEDVTHFGATSIQDASKKGWRSPN